MVHLSEGYGLSALCFYIFVKGDVEDVLATA